MSSIKLLKSSYSGSHNCRSEGSGFSLVEVVVAVGIFALAIVGVIGLLVPTSKSITDVADSDSASRVISAVQSGLQKAGFTSVKTSIDANHLFFASKDGSKVGSEESAVWDGVPVGERFFEFNLVRNTTLSDPDNDGAAGYLAFTIVLRWPAYVVTGPTTAERLTDNAQKSVIIVPAAITR